MKPLPPSSWLLPRSWALIRHGPTSMVAPSPWDILWQHREHASPPTWCMRSGKFPAILPFSFPAYPLAYPFHSLSQLIHSGRSYRPGIHCGIVVVSTRQASVSFPFFPHVSARAVCVCVCVCVCVVLVCVCVCVLCVVCVCVCVLCVCVCV